MLVSLNLMLLVIATLLAVPAGLLLVEVIAALFASPQLRDEKKCAPQVAILVPAHDEELVVAAAVRDLAKQLKDGDRLIVVADNCTDRTAQVATDAGATVITRNDASHRGKGYALDFGIRFLEKTPPDVVVIVDADCGVAEGSIEELARCCMTTGRPAQALYLMNASAGAGTRLEIAAFAWLLKNYVRPLGLHALGLPCQLMGSGMAFRWEIISKAPLASGHLVEDLKLGLDLSRAGHAPVFCPQALVTSCFPSSLTGTAGQRTRWEHGHLGVILREAPRLMMRAVSSLSFDLLALVLDLSIPPLALLTILIIVPMFAALLLLAASGSWLPLVAFSCDMLALFLAVGIAWWKFGRSDVLNNPWNIARYLLWKLPLYGKFVISKQRNWVRSERGDERHQ